MPGNILIVDKKTASGTFRYEERIKSSQFRENVDYTVDKTGNSYIILSPQLRKDIMIIQNPYNENIDVSQIEMKVLIDRKEEINFKPQIVLDLEKREKLIEVGRGVNNFTRSLPSGKTTQLIGDRGTEFPQIQEIKGEEMMETTETKKDDSDKGAGGNSVNKYFTTTTTFISLLLFLLTLI